MNKKIILGVLCCIFYQNVHAQNLFSPTYWRTQRHELNYGVGAANFLGELGGRDAIGTNFVRDLEFNQTRVAAQFAYGYYVRDNMTIRTTFNYAMVQGDDKLTQEPFRNNRNLNFRSNIFELGINFQWIIIREKMGNRYGLRNIKKRKIGQKASGFGMYLTAGVGGFYFNPKAKFNGTYVNLYQLHTEGQGLPGGPDQYKRISLSIPVGIGLRYAMSRRAGMYLELTQHYTFTDYIDDVSGVYYDNNAIAAAYGSTAAYLADPNLGNFVNPVTGESYATAEGEQRGDSKDKDNFMTLTLGGYVKLKNASTRKKTKRRKKVKALF